MAETLTLSERDIERLLTEPSDTVRAEVAVKVARQYEIVELTDRQRELAQDILGFMVHDAAVLVRCPARRVTSCVFWPAISTKWPRPFSKNLPF